MWLFTYVRDLKKCPFLLYMKHLTFCFQYIDMYLIFLLAIKKHSI